MPTKLSESLGFTATESKNKWRVKIIEAGWGSSGYYPAPVLAGDGPRVFRSGTKVFMNHPSISESSDRPERDVHQLAGKLVSNAAWDEASKSLYADVQFYSHYAPIIREMAEDVGISIHAFGEAVTGEIEGQQGPIIRSLVEDPMTSVDVVTVAGAGGKFISLLESYKAKDEFKELDESITEGNESMITKEEFDSAIADLKSTLVEALSPLRESISVLVEAATPAETEEAAEEVTPELDAVEVAEKFNESGLPKIALQRVAEALRAETNTKSVDELIADEKAYAASIRESIVEAAPVVETGVIHEALASTTPADEFNAIVGRIIKK